VYAGSLSQNKRNGFGVTEYSFGARFEGLWLDDLSHGTGVLQCVAACCSVLQCVAVRCNMFQCLAGCCRMLLWLDDLSHGAGVLQCVVVCCSVLQ